MIARPARVRIRSRKPWVFDRRRLFGWNVRLLTRYSHYTLSAVPPRRWAGARGARRRRCRSPVTPEAGHCGRTAPTDSSQHNRGSATADGRAHPDLPWPPRRGPERGRHAERLARAARPIVARLWTGLLASP